MGATIYCERCGQQIILDLMISIIPGVKRIMPVLETTDNALIRQISDDEWICSCGQPLRVAIEIDASGLMMRRNETRFAKWLEHEPLITREPN